MCGRQMNGPARQRSALRCEYRIIARVNYHARKVYILGIMKHSEYNKGAWK